MYYRYLSDGTKLSLGSSTSTLTQRYISSLVYNDGTFESASFGGDRIVGTNNGANSEVHYFLMDHLGSTRVVAKVMPTRREDLDRKDYYPFGKAWAQSDMPTSDNRYTFSGKEVQQAGTSSAHYLDFGARFYDPEGVTFLPQDPLLEKYFRIRAYNYCAGNPIINVDIDGKAPQKALYYLNRAISYNVSIGIQAGFSIDADKAKLTLYANARSKDIIRMTEGEMIDSNTTEQVQRVAEIGVGPISFASETTVIKKHQPNTPNVDLTRESSLIGAIGPFRVENTTTEKVKIEGNNIVINTKENNTSVKTNSYSVKAAMFIGVEISVNMDDIIRTIAELLTKNKDSQNGGTDKN